MKRIIRFVSLFLGLALVLSAFGPVAIADEKVTIRLWQRNSGSGGPLYEWSQAFNASQDKIEVVYEGYGENYVSMLNLALESGDPPDIFEVTTACAPVSDYGKNGLALPLDELLTDEFKADFNPNAFSQKEFSYDGKIYSVPLRIQHYKLLYNLDLFEAAGLTHAPQTLEELREYAKILTDNGKGKVYGFGFYGNYSACWLRHLDMFEIARGNTGVNGFDYSTGRFNFSTQKKMVDFWASLAEDGSLFPGAMTLSVEQMRANFAQGNVAMMIDGNWMSTQYAMNIPTSIHWDAAPLPIFEGEKRAKDYMTCDVRFCVAANGKNTDKALEVYAAILQNQTLFRSFGEADTKTYNPANTDECMATLPTKYVYQGLPEVNNVSNNACFTLEPHKFITLEGDTRDKVLNKLFTEILAGEKVDFDAAMDDLTTRYNAALDKALADGVLLPEDVAPAGFNYFNR